MSINEAPSVVYRMDSAAERAKKMARRFSLALGSGSFWRGL
jgi:hypothetical protein